MAAAVASGADGSVAYLAQEYVSGEALDAALRQHGVPPLAEALVTLGWLAEALDRAAGEGIHHGALHPRDVLVSAGGDARVIDVGVAEALQRAGLRAPLRRPYSAPERLEGRSWGGPADIFALGAIAHELVTGRRVAGPGTPSVGLDGTTGLDQGALAEVLGRALAADPAARFASASDLVDMLRPILARARRVPLARRRPKNGAPEGAVPLPLDVEAEVPRVDADAPRPEADVVPTSARRPRASTRPVQSHDGPSGDSTVAAPPTDPPDLPLTIAQEMSAPSGPPPRAPVNPTPRRPRTAPVDDAPGLMFEPAKLGLLEGATWRAEPAVPSQWPLVPLLVALLVGGAAGFGWGYWTAWRAAVRNQPHGSTRETVPPAPQAGEPTRVEEPMVRGEAALPVTPAPTPAPTPALTPAPQPAERPRPRRETPAAPPGRLLIKSTPSGARVQVNGRVRGRTPLILRGLPLRVMTVMVEQPGYKASEQRVALSAARPTVTVDARLVAEAHEIVAGATTGTLVLESRPSGARVFVDNQEIGTTPLSMPEVTPGNHRVRLELTGFNPWVTMAEITIGARTRVSASLEQGQQR